MTLEPVKGWECRRYLLVPGSQRVGLLDGQDLGVKKNVSGRFDPFCPDVGSPPDTDGTIMSTRRTKVVKICFGGLPETDGRPLPTRRRRESLKGD